VFSPVHTDSSNNISLLTVIVNNKNNKTSNKQQKRKVIEEKSYWNQPYVASRVLPFGSSVSLDSFKLQFAAILDAHLHIFVYGEVDRGIAKVHLSVLSKLMPIRTKALLVSQPVR
jgi:hypothetical protein